MSAPRRWQGAPQSRGALLVACAFAAFTVAACDSSTQSASPAAGDAAAVVADATGGTLTALHGTYVDDACGALEYDAEVVDLNGDGQPEVFTTVHGTCPGGGAGAFVDLYIKDAAGEWQPQLGFPGIYRVLTTRNAGFPDLEIGGPGDCFPVWRWIGSRYELLDGCSR